MIVNNVLQGCIFLMFREKGSDPRSQPKFFVDFFTPLIIIPRFSSVVHHPRVECFIHSHKHHKTSYQRVNISKQCNWSCTTSTATVNLQTRFATMGRIVSRFRLAGTIRIANKNAISSSFHCQFHDVWSSKCISATNSKNPLNPTTQPL
jgi:hypothetical protein